MTLLQQVRLAAGLLEGFIERGVEPSDRISVLRLALAMAQATSDDEEDDGDLEGVNHAR